MTLRWIRETPAHWDANKARIVGGAPPGIFDTRYKTCKIGELVPGEWWRVEDDAAVVGYGWLDVVWGDAEILLATDPSAQSCSRMRTRTTSGRCRTSSARSRCTR